MNGKKPAGMAPSGFCALSGFRGGKATPERSDFGEMSRPALPRGAGIHLPAQSGRSGRGEKRAGPRWEPSADTSPWMPLPSPAKIAEGQHPIAGMPPGRRLRASSNAGHDRTGRQIQ